MKMIGIVDEFGIESFMSLQGNYMQALLLIIRSKINFQTNAIFFCLDLTDKEIVKINNLIGSSRVRSFNEAAIFIAQKLNSQCRSRQSERLLGRFYRLRERISEDKIK